MPIDIYIDTSSPPCHAVLMTADHLGIKYNKKRIDIHAGEQFKGEFLKINPQHTVPTLDDGGFYLAESRAIQTYLANAYGPDNPIYPKNPKERGVVDRMLYFDIGTLFEAEKGYLAPLFRDVPDDPKKLEQLQDALELLEGFLSLTPYVAGGHITLADFSIFAHITFVEIVADYPFAVFPKISNWIERMKAEVPSYSSIEKTLVDLKECVKKPNK
ncbi:hypothetical protein JTE90_010050 [Oedothorax gibbosus]|uniref:Glutathione S-transferase n=1 Tax=Oedothorax gibbosus TaxID=931172 RepID=A0AAV6V646_9ARAC|nr:hypothetical protein JTE90_010050 [Oedothorax gibbosus]